MRKITRQTVLRTTGVASLANLILAWLLLNPLLATAGTVGLCYVFLRWSGSRWVWWRKSPSRVQVEEEQSTSPVSPLPTRPAVDPTDTDALVGQMLEQGRFALLLRPQIAENLDNEQLAQALTALEDNMALVPEGDVVLGQIDEALEDGSLEGWEAAFQQGRVVQVERFFLDCHPVTNRQFAEFVAAGGYEQMSLWDESIWAAVLDFVDSSGRPGPCYWKNGCWEHGRKNHPVVGVSWHEAAAYARWVGKRLPSDAEWIKAGSWPVPVSSTARQHRRYPWGNTMDRSRANLWGSGPDETVDVKKMAEGVSVGGVHQMIGNVWEWTGSDFQLESVGDELVPEAESDSDTEDDRTLQASTLKSIRGGAFDTYFDNQATCQFQSGERMMARKHNIGFRLAVGVCDLTLGRPVDSPAEAATGESAPIAEEVAT